MGKKRNYILIAISLVVLLAYVIFKEGYQTLVSALKSANIFWLVAAVGLMFLYWFLEAYILHKVTHKFYTPLQFKTTFNTSMLGQFFNCVTPFASGGQPIQAYYFTKNNVPLGVATCGLLAKFLVYQVTLTVYSIFMLVFKLRFFTEHISGFTTLVCIGFAINFAVMVGLICIGMFKNISKKFVRLVVKLLNKFHLVKNPEERIAYFDKEIEEFHGNFQKLRKEWQIMAEALVLSVVQLTVYFLISYFIYLSFGLPQAHMTTFIAAQAFTLMISSFVPLPGAMGGAEMGFMTFFKIFFPPQLIGIAMLLWRLITFYMPIGVGMFFVRNLLKTGDEKAKEITESIMNG